ncbi:hypothetical protein JCGZ_10219 [Jatropha curcas]|uniref:Protein SIEVE ELEMENT OCCLUSION B-like n=1 Tax=Jatropha curcas TaxID=180498 RepID=A0A067LPD3_JATCU|nr:hypothetical protein JCGZ_10219 [Jatropha curcas]
MTTQSAAADLDDKRIKQMQKTHYPDGRDFNVKSLLLVVQDILSRTALQGRLSDKKMEVTSLQSIFTNTKESLSTIIDQISSQISSQSIRKGDPHEAALSLFRTLKYFDWDAKLVLTMAAFALSCVTLSLLLQQLSISNKFSKTSLAIFGLPKYFEKSELDTRFNEIKYLMELTIKVSNLVIEFRDLPSVYMSLEDPKISEGLERIPVAIYWTIRSVLACLTHIIGKGLQKELSIRDDVGSFQTKGSEGKPEGKAESEGKVEDIPFLTTKLKDEIKYLTEHKDYCEKHTDEKKNFEKYLKLLNVFDTYKEDNMEILKILIPAEKLYYGRWEANIEVLRRKQVILLISNLDLSKRAISVLQDIFYEFRYHRTMRDIQIEMVWIPIVDCDLNTPENEPMKEKFEQLKSKMSWHTLFDPNSLSKEVNRLIKDVWRFRDKPIMVVLDSRGDVVCSNAIHMMWIWRDKAYPFTKSREEKLWNEEKWGLELLVDSIDRTILNWVKENKKYIFLYGGDKIEWLTDFITTAREVANKATIQLQMVYVGQNARPEDQLQPLINKVRENSYYYTVTESWIFWTRIESMLSSRIQMANYDDNEDDTILQEIKKVINYDREGDWVLFGKGSQVFVNGQSNIVLRALKEFDQWKDSLDTKEFGNCLKEHYDKIIKSVDDVAHLCFRFDFPAAVRSQIPRRMICPECHCTMDRKTSFLYCYEDGPS